ncbi:polyketide synthase [Biomphalaria pfeifferi]|uniref:Polyketide synthase n=1 Tax=Biomphalaria pfeifferi TaxID=112525 RepID=A0AAD8ESV4_BIOPF|nr:polyketide synthase [Biomphalaria pfeifferi]
MSANYGRICARERVPSGCCPNRELADQNVPTEVVNNPNYVKAAAIVEDIDKFDADFFGYSPKEAETTDPQHRLLLECAWEALENAGCVPERFEGSIGVFVGGSLSTYLLSNLLTGIGFESPVDNIPVLIGNDKDYLATRLSYKLNLKGPSINIQTACSSSLVAIHTACQSLLNGECDAAIAGGVTIRVPQAVGYFYQEGGYLSPDGRCKAFADNANGTIFGNGVGVVVLKRLADAIADGDRIEAVIKGSAVNNDGAAKIVSRLRVSRDKSRLSAKP